MKYILFIIKLVLWIGSVFPENFHISFLFLKEKKQSCLYYEQNVIFKASGYLKIIAFKLLIILTVFQCYMQSLNTLLFAYILNAILSFFDTNFFVFHLTLAFILKTYI